MKTWIPALATALMAAATLALPSAAFAKEASASLKYTGWSCAGCAGKVEKAVKSVKGVKTATVTKDTITVTYDDEKAKLDAIKTAVNGAGEGTGHFKIVEEGAEKAPEKSAETK